ncbi:MAG: flagellar basal-body rod protein FlgF [Geobacteraceae bacterium]|nr:flagellar basal-body rod protein FlgF [Geobacteraceae bacterium]
MNSGIYAALSGGLASMKRMDVLANNLANSNTTGFKKGSIQFESILAGMGEEGAQPGAADTPLLVSEQYGIDFSPGPLHKTGNTLDLALDGDGFFVVNTPEGKAYTRQGNFRLDGNGTLVTADGREVLGRGGPIVINGSSVSFDAQGKIFVEGIEAGAIDVVDFPKPYALKMVGNGLFMPREEGAAGQPATKTSVIQGSLEGSNVNTIEEMARIIETTRGYEACQKAIQNYDTLTGKAVNELGKV